MMNSNEKLRLTLEHKNPDGIVVDLGSSPTTGIHVKIIEGLREYYGLEKRPVRVIEPYQMLGLVEDDLVEAIGTDVIGVWGRDNMFGYSGQPPLKTFRSFWGQELLVPEKFNTEVSNDGNLYSYPEGNKESSPSAVMPASGYFFDAIERQHPIVEEKLDPAENLEEFTAIPDDVISYWKTETEKARQSGKGIIAAFGGTALGDIALVPAMQLKNPKGIRSVAEWYMSTLIRPDYVREIFDKQSEIAVQNLGRIYDAVGNNVDVAFICGTDFGTQDSTFCSPEQFDDLWLPYYQRINDWIHKHTTWKTFKHSCGAVEGFMGRFIDAGFDIINPVQVNAKGMDPLKLKKEYGDKLTFWGGGIDTQNTLPYGNPQQVKEEVLRHCEIFGKDGGFVFNTVHNIQANVPIENVVAMIETLKSLNNY
jgi:uroporphyrinogen-III decarboxylase